MTFNWDRYKPSSDWIIFDTPGDEVTGTVAAIRNGTDFNGNECPELVLDVDGNLKVLTAGHVMLRSALAVEQPQVGDKVTIVYTGLGDARPGKKPAKLFNVTVQRGSGGVTASDLLA